MWSTPKLVAHAYRHIALQELWSSVNLNFSETAKEARFLTLENIWISTKVEGEIERGRESSRLCWR
jgi:hypothetical protein